MIPASRHKTTNIDCRVRQVLDGLSADVFSLDLSDPATHPAAEAFLAGRLSVLQGLGVDVRGWAR